MRVLFSIFLGWIFSIVTFAQSTNFSLEIKNANLADTLRLIAKFESMNVVISPEVKGNISLNLHDSQPKQVLDLLLTTYGLEKWHVGNVLFVGPRAELIKRKQEESKWLEVHEETAPLMTEVWHVKYDKADNIAQVFHNEHSSLLSKRGKITTDLRTNMICVQDIPEKIINIRRVIQQLDVPVQQIVIDARLISIDQDYERELGIQFGLKAGDGESVLNTAVDAINDFSVTKMVGSSWLDVKLSALENEGHAELISSPSLFTANQQTASIEAGEEIPYQEISRGGGTAMVFKKAVLGLKVTPQVLPQQKVLLQLQINQDRPTSKLILGMPTINTRQMMTNVLVKSGQTIILGGIYETNQENTQQGVPFLDKIPLLGMLFRQHHHLNNKRELLIFVRPTIIT